MPSTPSWHRASRWSPATPGATSVYLKPDACAFALRVSNHARTPKQRKNHPDAITSLGLRDPTSEAALAAQVAVALRNFAGERAKREQAIEP